MCACDRIEHAATNRIRRIKKNKNTRSENVMIFHFIQEIMKNVVMFYIYFKKMKHVLVLHFLNGGRKVWELPTEKNNENQKIDKNEIIKISVLKNVMIFHFFNQKN